MAARLWSAGETPAGGGREPSARCAAGAWSGGALTAVWPAEMWDSFRLRGFAPLSSSPYKQLKNILSPLLSVDVNSPAWPSSSPGPGPQPGGGSRGVLSRRSWAPTGQESCWPLRPCSVRSSHWDPNRKSWVWWLGSLRPKDREEPGSAQIQLSTGHTPQVSCPDPLLLASTTSLFSKSRHVGGTGGQGGRTATVEEKIASRARGVRHSVSLQARG